MKKVSLSHENIGVNGLPWFSHNDNKLWRLPYELEDSLLKEVWETSQSSVGGRIRFSSDTTTLGMLLSFPEIPPFYNMSRIGLAGIDLYVDGKYWTCIFPKEAGEMEGIFFKDIERKTREFTIYLPTLCNLDIKKIIFDANAEIHPAKPYSLSAPVLFYGTSIEHGGCVSNPGLTYPSILSRELDFDFFNIGISGEGKGEIPIAKEIAKLDVSCYVLSFGTNNGSVQSLQNAYLPFVDEIRKVKKQTPIILVTPIPCTLEFWSKPIQELMGGYRRIVRESYRKYSESGDKNIYLVEGPEILPLEYSHAFADQYHPNDLGTQKISEGLQGILKKVLKL